MAENREMINLEDVFIVLAIPADTVEVEICATVYLDGELKKVSRKMPFNEVREAIKEADDGYIPSDAVFSLVPMGEDKIAALIKKYMDKTEE